jgi:hypothetical protein
LASWVEQRKGCSGDKAGPGDLSRNALQHAEHRVVLGDNPADGISRVDAQRLQFAQQQKAEDMVDVGVGQNGSSDGRLADAFVGMKLRRGFDLRTQVRRSAEQEPGAGVGADGNLRLGSGFAVEGSGAQGEAVGAGAIPLGESSAGSGA